MRWGHIKIATVEKERKDRMPKECLEAKAHIWIFPPGEGKEVSNGPHSGGRQKAFTKYTKIVVKKQNKATCSICNQTYTANYEVDSGNRKKKWVAGVEMQDTGKKRRRRRKKNGKS